MTSKLIFIGGSGTFEPGIIIIIGLQVSRRSNSSLAIGESDIGGRLVEARRPQSSYSSVAAALSSLGIVLTTRCGTTTMNMFETVRSDCMPTPP